eukprot:TRINITY_DN4913_c1_g1_i2.p1 TRINITY_DN4913_c1_g1~~TRINITY_DN4913_c1_g1_i2.p1  ORF type:complete len:292 (-),score=46.03 TRINITY_DN4913_c1_g1_i2:34-909(-)
MKIERKVKSMQMFKKPVDSAIQGDRVGICVTQFDPTQLERGLVCSPGSVPTFEAAVVSVNKIKYFKGPVKRNTKFHVTIGHSTVMATSHFFSLPGTHAMDTFDFGIDYLHDEELTATRSVQQRTQTRGAEESSGGVSGGVSESGSEGGGSSEPRTQWCLLLFERPVACPARSLYIASKLDTDIHTKQCRLAFHGKLIAAVDDIQKLRVYKVKERSGTMERIADPYTIISKGLFKRQTDLDLFLGLRVRRTSNGAVGVIDSSFGKTGKFKVRFNDTQTDTAGRNSGGGPKRY